MSKCTVSFSHTMHILLTFECATLIIECVHDFSSQFVCHRLTATLTRESNHILHRNAFFTIGTNFCRNLESSTTDTAALHLHLRGDIIESLLPYFEGRLLFILHLSLNSLKCIVENFIRCRLLTIIHQMINEFRHFFVVEDWIW